MAWPSFTGWCLIYIPSFTAPPAVSDADQTEDGAVTQTPTLQDIEDLFDEPLDFRPNKDGFLDQMRADLDISGAWYEIWDNADDAFHRTTASISTLKVEVEYHNPDDGPEELIIRDNAGGVAPSKLDVFFKIGASDTGDVQSRGCYGVGVKKATLRLADSITFATRHHSLDSEEAYGYGFTVTDEWIRETDSWTAEPERHDIKPGTTEIRLRDLRFDWGEHVDDIRTGLASKYRRQLGASPFDESGYAEFVVDREELTPPPTPAWAFPALDELHPREFIVNLTYPSLSDPITVRAKVGLLTEKDQDATGTDIYVQGRLIHEGRTDEQGGFGVSNGLREHRDETHGRFKLCLAIESEAPADRLPWNTTKDRLFVDAPLMDEVWNHVRRFADRYMAATFDKVPAPFLRFPQDHEHAGNGGTVEGPLAYDQGEQVTDKPTRSDGVLFPTVREVTNIVTAHAKLGIQRKEMLEHEDATTQAQMRKVYLDLVGSAFEDEHGDLAALTAPEPVGVVLPDFTASGMDVQHEVEEVKTAAKHHAAQGVRYTGMKPWKEPLYEAFLEQYTTVEVDELTPVETRPTPPTSGPQDDGDDGDDDESGSTTPVSRDVMFEGDDFDIVAETFGVDDEMRASEFGRRVAAVARRLNELGVNFDFK